VTQHLEIEEKRRILPLTSGAMRESLKTFKAAGVDTKKTLSTFGEKNNANY